MLVVLATGCASGFDATARQSYAPGDGVQGVSGDLQAVSALVVAPDDGGTGVVLMAVVNNGDEAEEITSVETDAGEVDYTGSREIPPGETVIFGAGSDPSATVRDLSAEPGEAITVKLSFANAEPINLRTVVVEATGDYESVTLPPEPSPTASESGVATPGETASPAPISSPSTS
jgi:hypothetical protein